MKTTHQCEHCGEGKATETILWVPEDLRGTHDAAPHPGLWQPLRLCGPCYCGLYEYVVEGDGADTESEYYDWRSDVGDADETGNDK